MELENYKSDEPCLACNESRDGYVCYHHMVTRKNLGPDERWNLIPLCSKHHVLGIHQKGTTYYAENFPKVKEWLMFNGWEYVPFLKKWIPPSKHDHANKSVMSFVSESGT